MSKELARYLTILVTHDIDKKCKGMCMSSYECEVLERAFQNNSFKEIENFLRKKINKED